KGKHGQDAKTLLAAAQAFEAYQKRLIRVATYANLRVSADGSDPENQADAAKVASAVADINAQLAYCESELLRMPKEKRERYIKDEPGLDTSRKMLHDMLDHKPTTWY